MRRKRRTRSITRGITRSLVDPLSSGIAGVFGRGLSGLLSLYPGATAAYSLRKIGSGPVVRLRRASDNAESDFTAADLVGSVEGAELITNGDFAGGSTGWTLSGPSWSITGGQAVCDGTQVSRENLVQNKDEFIDGGYYLLSFDIVSCSDFTDCGLRAAASGGSALVPFSDYGINSTGSYTALLDANINMVNLFQFFCNIGASLTVDNVSVKPYTPTTAELWAFQSGTANQPWGRQTTDSAYATTWYDQSGSGNDATQATSTAQPKLITAGVTELENGKPAMVLDSDDSLENIAGGTGTARDDSFMVMSSDHDDFVMLNTSDDANKYSWVIEDGGSSTTLYANYGTPSLYLNGSLNSTSTRGALHTDIATGNQTLLTTIDGDTSSWTGYKFAGYTPATFQFEGKLQELVIYPSDQSANRIGIETNINDHYGIY